MAISPSFVALTLGLGIMATQNGVAQAEPAAVIPIIDIQPSEGSLGISARASALAPANVTAELSIERHGRAGNVSTSQSRSLELDAGESGDIARTSVSFAPGDTLSVKVTLRQDGRTVGQASLAIGGGQTGQ